MRRVAVIDIGTNSTRLLVADIGANGIVEVARETEVTKLGSSVDADRRLPERGMRQTFDALRRYRDLMDELGVRRSITLATSAMRDSHDGRAFIARVRRELGIEARTISGYEEARLSFAGATWDHGKGVAVTMVIDIGGGSTEIVVGRPKDELAFHSSSQLGSMRQSERFLGADPPTQEELDALREEVRETFAVDVPSDVYASVERAIAVAGSATSLAAVDQALDQYDRGRVHGYVLERDRCEAILSRLAGMSLAERRALPGLHPRRAATIVAGAAILAEAMRAFRLHAVEVSEADILHGAALSLGEK